jgi:hypothetical protein
VDFVLRRCVARGGPAARRLAGPGGGGDASRFIRNDVRSRALVRTGLTVRARLQGGAIRPHFDH